MRRAIGAGLAVGVMLTSSLLTAPKVSAASLLVRWTMDATRGQVRDPTSGLSLTLEGAARPVTGAVVFGDGGRAGLGVADDGGLLNPGTGDFGVAVTLTTRTVPATGGYSPNVVQKGTVGGRGQWKIQLRGTRAGTLGECRFGGSAGVVFILDQTGQRLDDGQAHNVACWKSGGLLGLSVDGINTTRATSVGSIATSAPTKVANRRVEAGMQDQVQGTVSCVVYATGPGARETAIRASTC